MSATEELRRMLDERGIPWKEHRHQMPGSMQVQVETMWGQPVDQHGRLLSGIYHSRAAEMGDGRLLLEAQLVTPAQAIAATIGGGDDMLLVDALGRAVAHLERKNTELKELIRDLWISYDCDETAPSVAEHWHERMRALGVEAES